MQHADRPQPLEISEHEDGLAGQEEDQQRGAARGRQGQGQQLRHRYPQQKQV